MTSKLTREWLQHQISAIEAVGITDSNTLAAFKLALAALDSEPVAWTEKCEITNMQATGLYLRGFPDNSHGRDIPLYRHVQPAPVVPDDSDPRDAFEVVFPMPKYVQRCGAGYAATSYSAWNAHDFVQKWEGWKACRAAMLQGKADGTLTNEDTKQAWTGIPDIDNAINMLDRIDTLESCDDDRIEAVKAVLCGQAGNSPVIPEGYVMVPKEPTERMVIDGFESEPDETFSEPEVWEAYEAMSGCGQAHYRARLCWAAMISAAPKQENI